MKTDYDIAIIGAGPSGTACALALKDKGLRVVLIDKDQFPRDKICGDAIPGPAFKAMQSLNHDWAEEMKAIAKKEEITTARFFLQNNKSIRYRWISYSYNSKRIDFDNFLYQLVKKETDTALLENKRVKNVSVHNDHAICSFQDGSSISAALIVGCDGPHSIVKKHLLPSMDDHSSAAIRAYYRGIDGMCEGVNEFHVIPGSAGYFWIFPLPDGWANIGFGVFRSAEKTSKPGASLRHTLDQITGSDAFAHRFRNATLVDTIDGFKLPIWTKKTTISGHRFMLCGDAASLIDPIQGHGIDHGMWSGILAAKQIEACFRKNNFSAANMLDYDIMINQKLGKDLRNNYLLMRVLIQFPILIRLIFWLSPPQPIINWIIRTLKI